MITVTYLECFAALMVAAGVGAALLLAVAMCCTAARSDRSEV